MSRSKHPEVSSSLLITGAAGMIGSAMVRHYNDRGFDQLILVDNLREGEKWKNLLGKRFTHLIPKQELFQWLEGREGEISGVLHLGACSDTTEKDVDYLLENNFRYSVRLATWALKHQKKFVYASSAATYGDGSLGFSDDESLLGSLRPLNPYGFSKHLFDLWLQREGLLNQVIGLKYFNVFGPNEYHKGKMASMVLKMTSKVLEEGVIRLYKSNDPNQFDDGEQVRDFIYVKDAVEITALCLEGTFSRGGIFNVGSGITTSWNRLAQALFAALGKKTYIEYIDMPEELTRQYQNYTCAQMEKLSLSLSSSLPHTPISEAVKEYVTEFLLKDERW